MKFDEIDFNACSVWVREDSLNKWRVVTAFHFMTFEDALSTGWRPFQESDTSHYFGPVHYNGVWKKDWSAK